MLQPKYPKLKPTLQVNIYIEDDQQQQASANSRPSSSNSNPVNDNDSNQPLKVLLNEEEGYFQIGKTSTQNSQTFIFTIIIAFARNLIKVVVSNIVLNIINYLVANIFFVTCMPYLFFQSSLPIRNHLRRRSFSLFTRFSTTK